MTVDRDGAHEHFFRDLGSSETVGKIFQHFFFTFSDGRNFNEFLRGDGSKNFLRFFAEMEVSIDDVADGFFNFGRG
ncbi:Uncharacterised protein [Mycobacterium tuberculosis]|nr:Uncharacterised protein [Mycobacterium tuberculosis]